MGILPPTLTIVATESFVVPIVVLSQSEMPEGVEGPVGVPHVGAYTETVDRMETVTTATVLNIARRRSRITDRCP